MFAVTATSFDAENPLAGLTLGEVSEPEVPDGWALVTLRAAALNHHDIWSLKGVGLRPELLPMILGCDGAGIDADGNEVIIHAVIADPDAGDGDETLDPRRSLLSERFPGTLAERIAVPRRNLIPKPASLTFEQAACLPTSWLTAYRMLFTRAALRPGDTVRQRKSMQSSKPSVVPLGQVLFELSGLVELLLCQGPRLVTIHRLISPRCSFSSVRLSARQWVLEANSSASFR